MHEVSHPDLLNLKWLGNVLSPFGDKDWVADNIPVDEHNWEFLIMVGSQCLVLPSLYKALLHDRILSKIPKGISEALEGFYVLNNHRNGALRDQVLELSLLLNSENITPVWLKGATNLIREDWRLSSNMMVDLDFWIPAEEEHETTLKLMAKDGYVTIDDYPDEIYLDHHFAPRFKDSYPASVEFHRHICGAVFNDILNDEHAIHRIEKVFFEGTNVGQLCLADRLMNSYLQCIHFHGDINTQEHDRLLTKVISFRKTLDFLERFADSPETARQEFFHKLYSSSRFHDTRRFFSVLNVFFGLDARIEIDIAFLQSINFATKHRRLLYGKYMFKKILNYTATGRLGHPNGWTQKLSRHLTNLHSRF